MNWTKDSDNWQEVFDGDVPAHNPRARTARDGSCTDNRTVDEIHRVGFVQTR